MPLLGGWHLSTSASLTVVTKDGVYVLDLAAKVDATADYICKVKWGDIEFPPPFGREAYPEVRLAALGRRWNVMGTWGRVTNLRGASSPPCALFIWQEGKVESHLIFLKPPKEVGVGVSQASESRPEILLDFSLNQPPWALNLIC